MTRTNSLSRQRLQRLYHTVSQSKNPSIFRDIIFKFQFPSNFKMDGISQRVLSPSLLTSIFIQQKKAKGKTTTQYVTTRAKDTHIRSVFATLSIQQMEFLFQQILTKLMKLFNHDGQCNDPYYCKEFCLDFINIIVILKVQ